MQGIVFVDNVEVILFLFLEVFVTIGGVFIRQRPVKAFLKKLWSLKDARKLILSTLSKARLYGPALICFKREAFVCFYKMTKST